MYREDRTAAEGRFVSALARRTGAAARLAEQLAALDEVNRQLDARSLPTGKRPEWTIPKAIEVEVRALALDRVFRAIPELEAQTAQLEREAVQLARLLKVLSDRLAGEEPAVTDLVPGPRAVPWAYFLHDWTQVWSWPLALMAPLVAPLLFIPIAFIVHPRYAACTFVVLWTISTWRALRRAAFLRWCRVARVTVVGSTTTDTDCENWPTPHARGWEAGTISYSGRVRETSLAVSTHTGLIGHLVKKGAPYEDGVVLYDPRAKKTVRARLIEQLACGPEPDEDGHWRGTLTKGQWALVIARVALVAAIGVLAVR